MRLWWETPRTPARPNTYLFEGKERESGKVRHGLISATTKRSALRALRRDGLRAVRLEPA